MEQEQINELRTILSNGKDCTKLPAYRQYYTLATGKVHQRGCSGCDCKFLFTFLSSYLNLITK